jgi:hypothetical protein
VSAIPELGLPDEPDDADSDSADSDSADSRRDVLAFAY